MKRACAEAIARMARAEASDVVLAAYGADSLRFGPDYIIPKPFDPRLILEIAPLVAQAAMDTGVATRPITDMAAYRERLQRFVFRSGLLMKPVFDAAARAPRRVVYAEGEAERVLHCAQQALQLGIAEPILIGDTQRITERIRALGLTDPAGRGRPDRRPEPDRRRRLRRRPARPRRPQSASRPRRRCAACAPTRRCSPA